MILRGNGLIVQDLLRCVVLCRSVRFFLVSNESSRVWRAARECHTRLPVPSPRVGMTEHEWALFLFSRLNKCVVCTKNTSQLPASYTSRLTICPLVDIYFFVRMPWGARLMFASLWSL
ncbi:hypothetical protein BS47DRAFT_167457 [Hydnum rufescens UP504]|uniref:Uncharacterized protein n=1 Tax=Hydnum rufescens UP504 TaxID=1448309 RepID=A0A9P6E1P9_9AGAM|nr:hypothetical protein BS47DRAFT_167457 [Hydnum rufescens UP504]